MRVDVRVEPRGAGAEVELLDLAHVGQVVEGLVDGAERHRRHLVDRRLVDPLGCRVPLVAVQDTEDALPLRRHLEAAFAEELGELGRCLHVRHASTNQQ